MQRLSVNYQSVVRVQETWELARQKYSSEGEFGLAILLGLFSAQPGAKKVFGFDVNDTFESSPRLRAIAVVHGLRVVQILDGVMTLAGPNMEMVEEILAKIGDKHNKMGVDPLYILQIGVSTREAIKAQLGSEKYTDEDDEAWVEVFAVLAKLLITSMGKEVPTKKADDKESKPTITAAVAPSKKAAKKDTKVKSKQPKFVQYIVSWVRSVSKTK